MAPLSPRVSPRTPPEQSEPQSPRMARLAGIVVFCFGLGVSWPLLAGIEFVPRPPRSDSEAQALRAAERALSGVDPAATSSDTEPDDVPADDAEESLVEVSHSQAALVRDAVVATCGSTSGAMAEHCDKPGFRDALDPLLAQLARCDVAQGAAGTLSLGLQVDFARRRIAGLRSGRSTTFSSDKVEGLLRCAKAELSAVSLKDIAHVHPQYWVYYRIEFVPPGSRIEPGAEAASALVEASGYATVGWNTAAVREAPAEDAAITKQLLFGARIKVTGRRGDWYRVAADGKGRIGWVHKSDVGL